MEVVGEHAMAFWEAWDTVVGLGGLLYDEKYPYMVYYVENVEAARGGDGEWL